MIFKTITKIPDIDSYFYYRTERNKFVEKNDLKIYDLLKNEKNNLIEDQKKFLEARLNFSFSKKNITGKYLFLEKKGLRIRTSSKILSLLRLEDFKFLCDYNPLRIVKKRLLDEFEILKFLIYLKSEYTVLSNTKTNFIKCKQKLIQYNRFTFPLTIKPQQWIPNKGMWAKFLVGLLFNPYSKTPQNLKNKYFKNTFYPSRIKEFYFEPIPKKSFRYFLILDIKKKIWIIQTKNIKNNFKFLGSIYLYKFPYAFIVGINGVPVLLHRNQLFLSCRQMKKFKNSLKFTEFFLLRIFAKYKSEKRINVIIQNRIISSKNFELKLKILSNFLSYYNKYIFNRNKFLI